MATATTEAPQQNMTAETWFEGGGQLEELQRITALKDATKRREALQQFNETNGAFLKSRIANTEQPSLSDRAKAHPAIDEAINDAMKRETDWMRDIRGMSDGDLRQRYLSRMLEKDINRQRVEKWTSPPRNTCEPSPTSSTLPEIHPR